MRSARISLVHAARGAQATIVVGHSEEVDTDTGRVAVNFDQVNGWRWGPCEEPIFFDYDGDGESEVFVSGVPIGLGADEYHGQEWHEVWTFRGGEWKPYPVTNDFAIQEAVDVDEDGRPDFRSRGPYERIQTLSGMAGSMSRAVDPLFVVHSRRDGTFRANDDVARAAVAAECQSTRLDLTADAGDLDVNDISMTAFVCARLEGASAAEIKRALKPHCKSFVDDVTKIGPGRCRETIREVIGVTPPFRITVDAGASDATADAAHD